MGAAALAAPALLAGPALLAAPALAAPAATSCETAGHPATSAQIVARSQADLTGVQAELAWLQVDADGVTTTSPAAWRLREQLDRLQARASHLEALRTVAFIRGDATAGSPAQFRAQEELDSLCNVLD